MKKLLLLIAALMLAACCETEKSPKPKYVFFFIGDGMGFNAVALTQATRAASKGDIGFAPLNFSSFPVAGYATTNAGTRLVTCSAAAGTALATGHKTSINTIGMTADHSAPLKSVAVGAKEMGYRTGVITSVSIDHATPASFYAHVPDRGMAYEIGKWAAKAGLDLYGGGGFVDTTGKDGVERDLYEILADSGYVVARGDFPLKGEKAIITQAEGKNPSSLPYAIDRQEDDLSLAQITRRSIEFLYGGDEGAAGFFLMVEGGQIDWAGHGNDGATIVREVEDMAEAMEAALEFYNAHPDETLIVVTADHETGGASIGNASNGYDTDLGMLRMQKISKGKLNEELSAAQNWDEAQRILSEKIGFNAHGDIMKTLGSGLEMIYRNDRKELGNEAARILNRKAGVGWTTGAHTAAFVPVYAIGAGAQEFAGSQDNTDIPRKIFRLMER